MGKVRKLLLVALVATCAACSGIANRSERELRLKDQLSLLPLSEDNVSLVADVRPEGDGKFEVAAVHVMNRHILVEDTRGRLYAFGRESMIPAWHYYGMKRPMRYRPYEGAMHYWTISGDEIHQINAARGVGELSTQLPFTPSTGAAGTAGVGFVGSWAGPSGNKTIYSVNAATGRTGWGYRTMGHVTGGPVVTPGARRLVVFPSHDGMITAVEAVAASRPDAPPAAWIFGSPTGGRMSSDLVLATVGEKSVVLASCEDGSVYCLDAITGTRVWEYMSGKALKSAPVATADAVYVANGDGLHCLSSGGSLQWSNADMVRFLCKRNGKVFGVDRSGNVVIADAKSGETTGRYEMGDGWHLPTNAHSGAFIAISTDGMAYAFTDRLKLD
jgi:outer membrane protein assembly factor BamB